MMTREDLISHLSQRLGWDEQNTTKALQALIDTLVEELKMGNEIVMDGFGVFQTEKHTEYILVDRDTKERYLMPPSLEVVFQATDSKSAIPVTSTTERVGGSMHFIPDDSLEEAVNSSFSFFEPTRLNEGVEFPTLQEVGTEPLPTEVASNAPRKKRKRRKSIWVPVLGGVAIALAVLFFFKPTGNGRTVAGNKNSLPSGTDKDHPERKEPTRTIATAPAPQAVEEKVTLEEGKTLRLLAEELYGSREFWIYIFLENKHQIENPNVVPQGLVLSLPDSGKYNIDAADSLSIEKAKLISNLELSQY